VFSIYSAIFIIVNLCCLKKTPEAETVVEENNSSPMTEITSRMTEITSRTELDVIEEAENELTEREDE